MKKLLLLATPALAFASLASAQTPEVHNHNHSVVWIKGSEHPELIKDMTAYRLFFLAFAEGSKQLALNGGATDKQVKRFREGLYFTAVETETTASILAEFRERYDAFLKDNHERTKNGAVDPSAIERRDEIVQDTINKLQSQLSESSAKVLQEHVMSEKAQMRVSSTEAQ